MSWKDISFYKFVFLDTSLFFNLPSVFRKGATENDGGKISWDRNKETITGSGMFSEGLVNNVDREEHERNVLE